VEEWWFSQTGERLTKRTGKGDDWYTCANRTMNKKAARLSGWRAPNAGETGDQLGSTRKIQALETWGRVKGGGCYNVMQGGGHGLSLAELLKGVTGVNEKGYCR